MMEEMKTKRAIAKAQFTRTEKSLRKLLENQESLQETIKRKFKDVSDKWQEVQDLHDEYVTLIDAESVANEEVWIEELLNGFELIEIETDKTLRKFKSEESVVVTEKNRMYKHKLQW